MRAVAKGILNWRARPNCSKWPEEEWGFDKENGGEEGREGEREGGERGKGKRVVWKV